MIIGVTGKSGSGKTTLANYLKEKLKNVKIIPVDVLVIRLILKRKDEMIRLFGEKVIENDRPNTVLLIKYPDKQKMMFDLINADLINSLLLEIEEAKKTYENIVIDYFKLSELDKIWQMCDYHILVEAESDEKRYNNIVLRYKEVGKVVERDMNEELMLRDAYTPKYHEFSHDFILINKYDGSHQKDIDIFVEKLNN